MAGYRLLPSRANITAHTTRNDQIGESNISYTITQPLLGFLGAVSDISCIAVFLEYLMCKICDVVTVLDDQRPLMASSSATASTGSGAPSAGKHIQIGSYPLL